jgi:hypothetical protein
MLMTYAPSDPVVVFNTGGRREVLWLALMRIFATVTRNPLMKMESEPLDVVEDISYKKNGTWCLSKKSHSQIHNQDTPRAVSQKKS